MEDNKSISMAQEEPQDETPNLPALIASAVNNPNIDADKLGKLLDINIKMMDRQAEIDFNQAMARLQPKLPEIKRTTDAHNSKYAKYEHIEREIRPFYTAEGFSISFNSKLKDGIETYYGTLSHAAGHSITAEMALPPDTSGSKNAIQAKGSTISYAKRYLVQMLLNIVTVGEDDDGDSAYPITDEQFEKLNDILDKVGLDKAQFVKDFCKVDSLKMLPQKDYKRVYYALVSRRNKQLEEDNATTA